MSRLVAVLAAVAALVAALLAFRYREGFVSQQAPTTAPPAVTVASSRPKRPPPPVKDSDEVLDDGIRALRTLIPRPPRPPPVRVTVPNVPRVVIPDSPGLQGEGTRAMCVGEAWADG